MTTTEQKPKYPKRLWLAGPAPYVPQETVVMPDGLTFLAFENGATIVTDAEQEAVVRKALGERVYDETPGYSKVHRRSGWLTTSRDAFEAHTDILES